MHASSARLIFKLYLEQVLNDCCPGWMNRISDEVPPLGIWPETLRTWVALDGVIPGQKKFSEFLSGEKIPAEVKGRLKDMYGRISTEHTDDDRFVGRTHELREVLDHLLSRREPPVLLIHGLGGIGKTALASQVYHICEALQSFDVFANVSAKRHALGDTRVISYAAGAYTLSALVDEIAYQLHLHDLVNRELPQQIRELKRYLSNRRALLFIDDWNSMQDPEESMIHIQDVLSHGSKALITSRETVPNLDVFSYRIPRMTTQESEILLRSLARLLNLQHIAQATQEYLAPLMEGTGGSPLAIRLVAGQLQDMSYETVLSYLSEAKRYLPDGEDHPNYQFYRYIYEASWNQLDEITRRGFLALSRLASEVHTPLEFVQDYLVRAGIATERSEKIITTLVRKSLIDRHFLPSGVEISIHMHTRQFLEGDIVNAWNRKN